MSTVTAASVQELRRATGAGMMDAKTALVECDGDAAAASQLLREKGIAKSSDRADRENSDGVVAAGVADGADGRVGAVVELRCETDFVAKSDGFGELAQSLLEAVLADGVDAVATCSDAVDELRITLKENIEVGRVERFEAAAGAVVDVYVHVQNGRGVSGVLVELDGGTVETAHDIALHVAATRPGYLSRDDIPAEVVAAERATLEKISRNEGKPEQALEKIVEGRLNGFYRSHALLEQKFVRDEKRTIGDVLDGAAVTRFAQVEIGA
ncbi:MAG TPA: translation elongation factor Ts [Acidimicrobiaceae bacterium]|nr:translation elongation factor Ts [Acidimicrobiaceae bacterium]